MSTSQPLPVQVSLPAKPNTNVISALTEPSDTDSKVVFGGVLSDELDSVSGLDATSIAVDVVDTANYALPLDGNDLPLVTDKQFQVDIASLDEAVVAISVDLEQELVPELNVAPIEPTAPILIAKDPIINSQVVTPIVTDTVRFVTSATIQPSKVETVRQSISLLPFSESGIDPETQSSAQFKESLQLQKVFLPLSRQAESGVETAQVGRVLEQFSVLNQKAIAPATIQTIVNPTPLSETGTVSNTAAQLSVDVPVQDQRWQKAFSQRVVWTVGNVQSAQLRLNPAELGRIDIQVNIDNDKANVVFTTQQGAVKEAIEQALPRLREMLAEQGVDLEKAEIFHDSFNQQQTGNNEGSSQQEFENRLLSSSKDSEELNEDVFVSQTVFGEDVVDYYV